MKSEAAFVRCLILWAATLGVGCAGGERMFRLSPFSEQPPSSERVNLWPLLYSDEHSAAVLWPAFDQDEHGFALRPLVYREDDELGVLWPLSRWDLEKGHGWALLVYRFEDNKGLFPVINLGSLSWVGPVWWTDPDASGDRKFGLFPLVRHGPGLHYYGPFWWTESRADDQAWWMEPRSGTFGLFPLFAFGDFNHVGPAWWTDGDEESFVSRGLFPIWFHGRRPGIAETVVLPLFWKIKKDDGAHVYTLLGDWHVRGEESGLNVYPLWWSWRSPSTTTRMLLPLFYYHRDGDVNTFVTPLGGRSWDSSGKTRFVNVLGPLFHKSTGPEGSFTSFLWPLFERRRERDSLSTRIAPLFRHRSGADGSDGWFLLGLGQYEKEAGGSAFRFWPLCSSSTKEEDPDFLYPWSIVRHWHDAESCRFRVFPIYSQRLSPEENERCLLLGLGRHHRSATGGSLRAWPLFSWSDTDGGFNVIDFLSLFGHESSETETSTHLGTRLVFALDRYHAGDLDGWSSTLLTFFKLGNERMRVPETPAPGELNSHNLERIHYAGFLFDWFKNEWRRYRQWRPGSLSHEEQERLYDLVQHPQRRDSEEALAQEKEVRDLLVLHGEVLQPDEDLRLAIERFAGSRTEAQTWRHVRIPLLFEYQREGESIEWDGLLWMLHRKKTEESSRFSFLYYGYRQETRGERTSRDIFPFITWDTAPEESRFSFLWRLFRYERRGERRGGHILFIPWGHRG